MNYKYSILENNTVIIFENEVIAITQPISPITGAPFATYEEAEDWAKTHIADRKSWQDKVK